MPPPPAALLRYLRRLAPAAPGAAGDADLLARLARYGDQQAFAALVSRHGPVVYGVCARALRHAADAEDAFQAGFLALARKAAPRRGPAALAAGLQGPALRLCRKAVAAAARRARGSQAAALEL